MANDDNYTNVPLEEMNGKFDAIIEAVRTVPSLVESVNALSADMEEVRDDVKIIKAAVTDTNQQVQDHEQRITRLEAARS